MGWQKYTIGEVKEYLSKLDISEVTEDIIGSLYKDKRAGVKKIAEKYQRHLNKIKARIIKWDKMSQYTVGLQEKGYQLIAGIDEAGRGPLAGPVVAAAVILDFDKPIYGLDDSKKLTEKKREELFELIIENATAFGVGIVDNKTIDDINILQATFKAMNFAVENLSKRPDYILVDGNKEIPALNIKQDCIVDGDSFVNSIAAASIIAKVTRDRIIEDYHKQYPDYGFDRNKGYGTSEHIEALKKYGTTPIHRFSFSIVNKYHFAHFEKNIREAKSEMELKEIGCLIAKNDLFSEDDLIILRKLYKTRQKSIVNY